MNKIKVQVLNPEAIVDAEQMMVFCARLTQRGHNIHDIDCLISLKNSPYKPETLRSMCSLPHPTIQKFVLINVAVVGASRRFLAQITRHQNEVKFMSASLQYSDYSGKADFTIPYAVLNAGQTAVDRYLKTQCEAMKEYQFFIRQGVDNDSAGYLSPQGLRNILIISATPYQWKHMIGQRICRRNTAETRYVMLKIWEQLYNQSPELFAPEVTGAGCQRSKCLEGKMCCGKAIGKQTTPNDILKEDFPLLYMIPKKIKEDKE